MAIGFADISEYQGNVDWSKYPHPAVAIRATDGTYVDKKLKQNQAGARSKGLGIWYYHFKEASTSATVQADAMLAAIGTLQAGESIVLDDENQATTNASFAAEFASRIKARTGLKTLIIYASQGKIVSGASLAAAGYVGWVANWGANNGSNNNVVPSVAGLKTVAKQFTSNGSLAGISGRVDIDVFYGTIQEFKALGASTTTTISSGGSTSTPSSKYATIQNGSSGQLVANLQGFLNKVYPAYSKLVVDGKFGPATTSVVKQFQSRSGITADGIVGPTTWGYLIKDGFANANVAITGSSTPAPAAPAAPKYATIQNGSSGSLVSSLQSFLNRVYPAYSKLVVDGKFGPATTSVVKQFQSRSGITADGIVGPTTWGVLVKDGFK